MLVISFLQKSNVSDTDPPKLHFSLQQGLKFVVPPKHKVVEKIKDEEEDEEEAVRKELLEVFTR